MGLGGTQAIWDEADPSSGDDGHALSAGVGIYELLDKFMGINCC